MNLQKIRPALLAGVLAVSLCGCAQEEPVYAPIPTTSWPIQSVSPLVTPQPADPTQMPEASPSAAPVQTPQPQKASPGLIAQCPAVEAAWFDDAVFVGDSVSLKLNYYNVKSADLGSAQFLTSGSLGSANALWDVSDQSVHPSFQGEKMRVEDAVALCGAKKLYIMLGMNDVGLYGAEESAQNLVTLLALILDQSPDLEVYVQSVTPMTSTSTLKSLTNEKILAYNALVLEACEQNGWYYVDVASVMTGADGCLPREYCSDPDDMGIHFTETACALWAQYLKTHTAAP